jgi:SAM-dependent methyltransferase
MDAESREERLRGRIQEYTAPMAWRRDHEAWVDARIRQEEVGQEPRLRDLRLAGMSPDRDPIVEIGSGMGGFVVAARLAGWRAVAVEPNPDYLVITRLRAARHDLRVEVFRCAGEAVALRSGSAAAVCMFDVLEHVEDPEHCLREAVRLLRPGGRLFLSVINRLAPVDPHYHLFGISYLPRRLADRVIAWRGRDKEDAPYPDRQRLSELHTYTFGGFRRLARRLGLEVRDLRESRVPAVLRPLYRVHRLLLASAFHVEARRS